MTDNVLENMQSQVDGVGFWADNMTSLAERGVDQGILQKLAEMGPEGVQYVQAFANMSNDELDRATELWQESLNMKEGVQASVENMLDEYTMALNGGKDQVTETMNGIGVDISTGLGNGIRSAIEQGTIAVDEMGKATIVQAKDTYGIQSPSKVFAEIGQFVTAGLAEGITGNELQAVMAIQMLSQQIVNIAQSTLNSADFTNVGNTVVDGIRTGVEHGSPAVLSRVSSLCNDVVSKAKNTLTYDNFYTPGKMAVSGLESGISAGEGAVERSIESVVSSVTDEAANLNFWTLYMDGYNTSVGLANGIAAGESEVINAVAQMCADAVAEAEYQLEINSPSKVFERIGKFTAEGFGVGYEKEMQDVNAVIADSMAIPDVNSSTMTAGGSASAKGSAFADAINLLQEYLPYLANIANKEVSLYPSKRQFETEVAQAADKGMEVIRKRAERR